MVPAGMTSLTVLKGMHERIKTGLVSQACVLVMVRFASCLEPVKITLD